MGWHSIITSDQEITEELLTSILQAAPETLKLDLIRIDNLDRCLMATDVSLKDNNSIRIGGSWSMSGHQAEPMRAYIKQQLNSRT